MRTPAFSQTIHRDECVNTSSWAKEICWASLRSAQPTELENARHGKAMTGGKMNFKNPLSVNVLSPLSMYRSSDFLEVVQAYCDLLPKMTPEKWGWGDLDKDFDAKNLGQMVSGPQIRADKLQVRQSIPTELQNRVAVDEKCQTVSWSRKKSPKAEGAFGVRWCSKSPSVRDTHALIDFVAELDQIDQAALVAWLKAMSVRTNAHLALMDAMTPGYQEFAMSSGSAPTGERSLVTTHILRHWLPDIFWGTVFGPPYVALFGKEELLNAPAAAAEEIGLDMIYIQLTNNVGDVVNDPEGMALKRKAFKDHVAVDAFFELGRSYDAHSRLEHGPFGTEYVTPKFELLDD